MSATFQSYHHLLSEPGISASPLAVVASLKGFSNSRESRRGPLPWVWDFWLATVIATSVWLLGDAVVHIYHIVVNQNYHPGNAGLPFYYDILLPLLLIVLLIVYGASGGGSDAERVSRVR